MQYEFAKVSTKRATIGDRNQQIVIETVDMVPVNDNSGDLTDSIVPIATVWAAVVIKKRGVHRMLTINTDGDEAATHEFWCRYWDEAFLEARFISWKGNRYRILRPDNLREQVDQNFQIRFPCVVKGSTSKEANTWAG